MKIITRFAPSPTGYLHIGNVRSILISYIYSKNKNGIFILRIDNTDIKRSKKKFLIKILNNLKWLGIKFDNSKNITFQNKRKTIYIKKAVELIKKNKAYYHKKTIKYRINKKRITKWFENKREIVFLNKEIKDFVIIRENGMATYNFSTVIDDFYIKTTHTFRGVEHISNTAKQINIADSLEYKKNVYIHFSNYVTNEKKKISKRKKNFNMTKYKDFFPQAIISYVMNSCGTNFNEYKNLHFYIQNFCLLRIKKSPTILNEEKMLWYNKKYIVNNFINIKNNLKNKYKRIFILLYRRINFIKDLKKKLIKKVSIKKLRILYIITCKIFLYRKNFKEFRNIIIKKENKFPILKNIMLIKKKIFKKVLFI
ncbi:glutamate--tRNA ligase family protein [Candidatus Vidania fulgoroideorum]